MQTEVEAKRKLQEYIREQQKYYVNALVVVTVQVIASIWPNSVSSTNSGNNKPIADLNTFLHHILKYSRTTHSTLQLAIFYLFRIRARAQERNNDVYVSCGRRMFLAALISAHKYLQDKTYKNSAWSKVSGLSVEEINHAEKVLLELLDYRLYVKKETYDEWITILQSHLNLGPLLPSVALETTTTTTTMASTIQHTTYQHRLNSIRKAEQSLPSPPLDEDISIHDPIQKRKNTCLYEPEDDRITKRRR
ncbi:cyclin-domain-containing protein [Cokeromyces recurvatus]|uniref:cyclin-domain-containing protein n=1 Tax=Cokeromyces recurvatus TaxID=90255 RepID=UPI00221F76F3|nr:cyclin-domain-containing protein [Cokeromyces recurvatus]KAI7903933.1 cyclin-domain-containing protein [Cokeromyces recurvatus]